VLHTVDLGRGAVLEVGCVYVAEIEETLALPSDISGAANPKSSTGRLDVFTRVIADHGPGFDQTGSTLRFALRLFRSWCGPDRGYRKSAFAARARPAGRRAAIILARWRSPSTWGAEARLR
jgi:hypothetical protein